MNVTILAALFTILIVAFFAFMSWAADKRIDEAETAQRIKRAERLEMKRAELQAFPAYKRKLNAEQLAKLEADLEGYKPTVREYYLPKFEL